MGDGLVATATDHVVNQLNSRFAPGDAITLMVALQREFAMFADRHSLRHAAALLNIVPDDGAERQRWFRYLDQQLSRYDSDVKGMDGHDRIRKAFIDNLESAKPLPMHFQYHLHADDPLVTVKEGTPSIIFKERFCIVSVPVIPEGRGRRRPKTAASK